jgi:hypothetical protein
VSKHIEAMLAVVMPHTSRPNSAERHRLDVEMNIGLVHRSAAVRKLSDKSIYRLLITAEDERG